VKIVSRKRESSSGRKKKKKSGADRSSWDGRPSNRRGRERWIARGRVPIQRLRVERPSAPPGKRIRTRKVVTSERAQMRIQRQGGFAFETGGKGEWEWWGSEYLLGEPWEKFGELSDQGKMKGEK